MIEDISIRPQGKLIIEVAISYFCSPLTHPDIKDEDELVEAKVDIS